MPLKGPINSCLWGLSLSPGRFNFPPFLTSCDPSPFFYPHSPVSFLNLLSLPQGQTRHLAITDRRSFVPVTPKHVKLRIWNLHSILNSLPSLRSHVYVYEPDIILVTETWSNDSVCESSSNSPITISSLITGFSVGRPELAFLPNHVLVVLHLENRLMPAITVKGNQTDLVGVTDRPPSSSFDFDKQLVSVTGKLI